MNYRNPHSLRVVTLQSRESTGSVLYPPEFAHLASSPTPGDATDPHSNEAQPGGLRVTLRDVLLYGAVAYLAFYVMYQWVVELAS